MDCEELNVYWTKYSDGFSEKIVRDFQQGQPEFWLGLLNRFLPKGEHLRVLDCGCGPGFFSILMSNAGHQVDAIDVSDGMLEHAKENVAVLGKPNQVALAKMDAFHTTFPDETFDVIINRNMTWMAEDLEETYREWLRILKPGGRMIVFDANWYLYEFDAELKKRQMECLAASKLEPDFDGYDPDIDKEAIVGKLPLASISRPEHDRQILEKIGVAKLTIDPDLPDEVFTGWNRVYYKWLSMFELCAEKKGGEI